MSRVSHCHQKEDQVLRSHRANSRTLSLFPRLKFTAFRASHIDLFIKKTPATFNSYGNANQTTLRFHPIPVRTPKTNRITNINAGEDVGKREPSSAVVGLQPLWKSVWRILKNRISLPYDPAILLSEWPRNCHLYSTNTCSSMFIATPVTRAEKWEQPGCPWADNWRMIVWYITLWNTTVPMNHSNDQHGMRTLRV